MSQIGQWALDSQQPDPWQESQNEAAATRQMEAEGCPSLPDLLPLVVPQQPINTLEALPF